MIGCLEHYLFDLPMHIHLYGYQVTNKILFLGFQHLCGGGGCVLCHKQHSLFRVLQTLLFVVWPPFFYQIS